MTRQKYSIRVSSENENLPNIQINIENNNISIILNHYRIFNTMANLETVLVALNDNIKGLIRQHLLSLARKEDVVRNQR